MGKIQNSLLITPGKGQKKHKKIYNSPLYLTSDYKEINSIGLYLQKVNETSSLSFKEEKKLFQRLEEGDLKAKETLIKANFHCKTLYKLKLAYVRFDTRGKHRFDASH